jgi:putative ABC transport system substrate-binding protein
MRDDASSSLPSRTGCRRFTLPVEQSTRFALVINLKAAKELGIDMPLSLMIRADEIIE